MTKKGFFAFFAALAVLLGGCGQKNDGFSYEVFETGDGWGYEIQVDGEPFIRQTEVPAVSGVRTFPTEKQAGRAAKLVIQKMEKTGSPTVTKEEMEEILGK